MLEERGNRLRDAVQKLRPFQEKFSKGLFREQRIFQCCVKAAFCRALETCQCIIKANEDDSSFMRIASLRGICEDLIVLRFLSSLKPTNRNAIIFALMRVNLLEDIETQSRFFQKHKPYQPALTPNANHAQSYEKAVLAAQGEWKKVGWAFKGNTTMPQIRQLAEKSGFLELYDFFYDLTSKFVHFRPGVLLRFGWGPDPEKPVHFSTKHFSKYYFNVGQIYASYLLCLYFELLPGQIRPDHSTKTAVSEIRECLLMEFRWPELVTFEEMNIKPPEPGVGVVIASMMRAAGKKRLLKASRTRPNAKPGSLQKSPTKSNSAKTSLPTSSPTSPLAINSSKPPRHNSDFLLQ